MIERHWRYYPAFRIAAPFAAGIIAAELMLPTVAQCLLFLAGSLGVLAAAIRRDRPAMPLALLLVACGALAVAMRGGSDAQGLDGEVVSEAEVVGRVAGDPVFSRGAIEYRIEPDSIIFQNSVAHARSDILLQIRDTSRFDPAWLPRHGERIAVAGRLTIPEHPANPGELDYAAYLQSRAIGLTLTTLRASSIYIYRRDDLDLGEHSIDEVRREARDFADRYVRGEEGDIVRALLIGERDYVDPATRSAYARTGTVHVLSVSGLHVGVIALALFVAVSWIRNRWVQWILFVLLIGTYVVIAGAGASILRASIMASAFMLARVTSRVARPLNTLGFAFLAILIVDPRQLFDVGFQLSFASVAGIAVLYGPLQRRVLAAMRPVARFAFARGIAQLLLLSVCAQLATLPLVLYHFGYVSLVAIIINIPVVPLYTMALGASVAGCILAPVLPSLAACLGATAYAALHLAGSLVTWGAGLSFSGVETGKMGIAGALIIATALLYFAFSRYVAQALVRGAVVILSIAGAFLLEICTDPLTTRGAAQLILMKGRNGVIVATARNDSLLILARERADSSGADRLGEALEGRLRLRGYQTRYLDEGFDGLQDRENGVMVINDRPREIAFADPPILLSNTSRRALAIVMAGQARLLQVPMQAELDEAIVLRYDGRWHAVEWR